MQPAVDAHRAPRGRGIPIFNSTNGGPPAETVDPGAFAVTLSGDSMETESDTGVVRVVKRFDRYQIWNWKRRGG